MSFPFLGHQRYNNMMLIEGKARRENAKLYAMHLWCWAISLVLINNMESNEQ